MIAEPPISCPARARVTARATPRGGGEARWTFFIWRMNCAGLMSSPPVSNVTPLPTSTTVACEGSPHVIFTTRGACFPPPAARPTACTCPSAAARAQPRSAALSNAQPRGAHTTTLEHTGCNARGRGAGRGGRACG